MAKLVIFDKDGTLVEPISGGTFVQHPADQRLRHGVAEKLAQLKDEGVMMAIASNQGGVAAGHKTLEDARAEMVFAMKLVAPYLHYETMNQFRGIFCPDMDGKTVHTIKAWSNQGEYLRSISLEYMPNLNYLKPEPGMLIDAEQWLRWSNIEVSERLMVGDRAEDQAAAEAAGFKFEWADVYFGGAL